MTCIEFAAGCGLPADAEGEEVRLPASQARVGE